MRVSISRAIVKIIALTPGLHSAIGVVSTFAGLAQLATGNEVSEPINERFASCAARAKRCLRIRPNAATWARTFFGAAAHGTNAYFEHGQPSPFDCPQRGQKLKYSRTVAEHLVHLYVGSSRWPRASMMA